MQIQITKINNGWLVAIAPMKQGESGSVHFFSTIGEALNAIEEAAEKADNTGPRIVK